MSADNSQISVEYIENAAVVSFTNPSILAEKDVQALQESLMKIVEDAERINLVLDFSDVRFLSSAVLGVLIRVSKRIYGQPGQLKLCNIERKIFEIFKITRLNKIFDICRTREEAIESLSVSD